MANGIPVNSEYRNQSPVPMVRGSDGKVYYLINAKGARGVANVTFVDYYSTLNQYGPEAGLATPTGFFFVRHAAAADAPDHYGDPTVQKGWAMYIFDITKYIKGIRNSGWVRIAQQGDVDWDIDDELKSLFVLKTTFNAYVEQANQRFTKIEARVLVTETWIANTKPIIEELVRNMHRHHHISEEGEDMGENLTVLNRLSEEIEGVLFYRGRPISGNSYIYDHVEFREETGAKEIVWCDPTKPSREWTHEIVENSADIAEKFKNCSLARIGLSLFVVEANGDVSLFKYIREGNAEPDEFIPVVGSPAGGLFVGENAPVQKTPDQAEDALEVYFSVGDPGMEASGPYYPDNDSLPSHDQHFRDLITDLESRGCVFNVEEIEKPDGKKYKLYKPTGDFANYVYYKKHGKAPLVAKFAQTMVKTNYGVAEYTQLLPIAAKQYVGRGSWVPLGWDGKHVPGHLHQCVFDHYGDSIVLTTATGTTIDTPTKDYAVRNEDGSYELLMDVVQDLPDDMLAPYGVTKNFALAKSMIIFDPDSGNIVPAEEQIELGCREVFQVTRSSEQTKYYTWRDLSLQGYPEVKETRDAQILTCYAVDTTMWTENRICWKDPAPIVIESDGSIITWGKTVLVRKVGSAPTGPGDGDVIASSTLLNEHSTAEKAVIDLVPYNRDVKVYYAAFATTLYGEKTYLHDADDDAKTPEKLTWEMIKTASKSAELTAALFQVGDEIVLPTHSVYGKLEADIVAVNQDVNGDYHAGGILVATKDVLCLKQLDAAEPFKDSTGKQDNPEYAVLERGSNGSLKDNVNVHALDTLNISRWLNSVTNLWWNSGATVWDQPPEDYVDEIGFMSGFDDRSMFGLHPAQTIPGAEGDGAPVSSMGSCYCTLANRSARYFEHIPQGKHLLKSPVTTDWVTYNGGPNSSTEASSRKLTGFAYGSRDGVIASDLDAGIVPILFIG